MNRSVSVVIPVLNNAATIAAQLEALAGQTYAEPFELIVADNGSSDRSPDVVREWESRLPGIRLLDAGARRGTAAARNQGLRAADGEFLLTCDADDVVSPQWIEALAGEASERSVLGGPLDPTQINPPAILGWRDAPEMSGPPVAFGRAYFLTANMAFSRTTFERLGGFRETFDRGGADVDFCLRAVDLGFEIRFVPDALVHYRHRSDIGSFVRQSFAYGRSSSRLRRAHAAGDFHSGGASNAALGAAGRMVRSASQAFKPGPHRVRLAGQVGYLAGRALGRVEPWDPDGDPS